MANTYTQLYVHIIFSTRRRQKVLYKTFRKDLFRYISGILKKKGQVPLAVNGTIDHIHIFTSFAPATSISELVRDIKHSSTNFIKKKELVNQQFNWQKGYGAFTYSKSQLNNVIRYITDQEEHHRHKSFEEEYFEFLKKFGIEFDGRHVFD